MNQVAAFPAWISAALLVAGATAFGVAMSDPEGNPAWHTLLVLVQALMLSSFVAAVIAVQNVLRASGWLAVGYILVSLAASWCLYVAQLVRPPHRAQT